MHQSANNQDETKYWLSLGKRSIKEIISYVGQTWNLVGGLSVDPDQSTVVDFFCISKYSLLGAW